MLRVSLGLITLGFGALILRELRAARKVPQLTPQPVAADQPSVAVIVPARNEVQRLPRLLDGLAAQTTTAFDLIILDDNSSDGTGQLAQSYGDRLPRLAVLTGTPLPSGWAGKCWACWQAAHHADAAWLLFLDADTAPAPALMSSLLAYATRHQLDFLTVMPFLELHTFWERVLMPPFVGLIQAVFPLHQVNDPNSKLALANGQCILIKRAVYVATGGHQAVAQSVLEDVELAQVVKGAGYRLGAVSGRDLLRVRMYTRFSEVAEGLRKNVWAGYAAGGWRSAWGGIRQALLAFTPPTLIAAGLWLRGYDRDAGSEILAWGLGLWSMTTVHWGYELQRQNRLNPLWAVLYPLGLLAYFTLAGWAWLTLRFGKGVTWKGRAYGNQARGPVSR